MPRINPRLLRTLKHSKPLLAKLLPVCRTIDAARNELRWLKEASHSDHGSRDEDSLSALVQRRARGEPLQYILGSEYFGNLEIKCRPGVLIPRQETAASVTYLVQRLLQGRPDTFGTRLRVLDLCTGTGCISLLFHDEFYSGAKTLATQLDLLGIDLSPTAISLAKENLADQQAHIRLADRDSTRSRSLRNLSFRLANVLESDGPGTVPGLEELLGTSPIQDRQFDVLISNPPYISRHHYRTVTASSVRCFEPKLALVPPRSKSVLIADGDLFYPRLLQLAELVQARTILFEIGDDEQAIRVARMAKHSGWRVIEILRDNPQSAASESILIDGIAYNTVGVGHFRSVYAVR